MLCAACGVDDTPPKQHASPAAHPGPFIADVVSFEPGPGAGKGADAMPDIIEGPPHGCGTSCGNTDDVVSLGRDGVIVVKLGADIVDGEGADLLVFENAFLVNGTATLFSEPGEVSVSADGDAWSTFACAPEQPAPNGCAGFAFVLPSVDDDDTACTHPDDCGGDAFDLADLADPPVHARYVRVIDRGTGPASGTSTGFDLDAMAVVAR